MSSVSMSYVIFKILCQHGVLDLKGRDGKIVNFSTVLGLLLFHWISMKSLVSLLASLAGIKWQNGTSTRLSTIYKKHWHRGSYLVFLLLKNLHRVFLIFSLKFDSQFVALSPYILEISISLKYLTVLTLKIPLQSFSRMLTSKLHCTWLVWLGTEG